MRVSKFISEGTDDPHGNDEPEVWECKDYMEVCQKATSQAGLIDAVFDHHHERFYIVGMCFGRREVLDAEEVTATSVLRPSLYFTEVSSADYFQFKKHLDQQQKEFKAVDKAAMKKRAEERAAKAAEE